MALFTDLQSLVQSRNPLDKSHIKLTCVANFYCNQLSIDMVTDLLRKYEGYPRDLLNHVEFIIVDDGSPLKYKIPQFSLNVTWLCINEDIKWNHAGAKNLGVVYAKSDKIIITDIDHDFPPETLQYLVDGPHPGRYIYKFPRRDAKNYEKIISHANTFFMSRARFMRHYGYDEEFAGHYGHEEYQFLRHHKYHGTKIRCLPEKYHCFHRVVDRDHSYHSLVRDLTYNESIVQRKRKEMQLFGVEQSQSRIFLNFTWQILYQNRLEPLVPPLHRSWYFFGWLRRLSGYLSR